MGQYEKEGRVEEGRILFIKFHLPLKIISRVVIGMDFIEPERFLIEVVEPEGKADEKAENENDHFILFCSISGILPVRAYFSRAILYSQTPRTDKSPTMIQ